MTRAEAGLTIRPAHIGDAPAVCVFYEALCAALKDRPGNPRWQWGLYPSAAWADEAIAAGTMHIALRDGIVVSAMLLNHLRNPRYDAFPWPEALTEDRYLVLHTLAVADAYAGQGVGTAMLRYAQQLTAAAGLRAIRLDVLLGNRPAERLYAAAGFTLLGSIAMEYAGCGMITAELFEWRVPEC